MLDSRNLAYVFSGISVCKVQDLSKKNLISVDHIIGLGCKYATWSDLLLQ